MKKSNSRKSSQRSSADKTLNVIGMVGSMDDMEPEDEEENVAPKPKSNGPITLRFNKKGKLESNRRKLKIGKKAETDSRKWADYDPSDAYEMLETAEGYVRKGKYGKGLDSKKRNLTIRLVTAFYEMDSDLPNFSATLKAARKLIAIARSYDEYDSRKFISDELYDKLVAKVRELGQEEPAPIVPSSKSGRAKGVMKYPTLHNNMLKAYVLYADDPIPEGVAEKTKIETWLKSRYKLLGLSAKERIKIAIALKIDGVSVNGTVDGEALVDVRSRGDSSSSLLVKGMDGIRLKSGIDHVKKFGIQMEAFCTEEDRINASEYLKLPSPYASCRNAASGIVQRLCAGDDDGLLKFICLYPIEAEGLDMSYEDRLDFLWDYGIVPDDMKEPAVTSGNLEQLLCKIEAVFNSFRDDRPNLSYNIDGIVITIVNDEYQKILGRTGRTNEYQIALKFDPASADAEVAGVHLSLGKHGTRNIMVDLKDTVFIDGIRYDLAYVPSFRIYKEMDLRKGSKVRIRRVGDAIPSISLIDRGHGKRLPAITHCPECWEELSIKDQKLFCANPQCPANLSGRIQAFIEALDIDGYGEEFADALVENFGPDAKDAPVCVRYISDLFNLTPDGFKAVGMKGKIPAAFPGALRKKTNSSPDYVVLGGIGIPGVGRERAKAILREYGSWDEFIRSLDDLTLDSRLKTALGDKVGEKVFRALRIDNGHENYIADLQEIGHFMGNFTKSWKRSDTKVGHTGLGSSLPSELADICIKRNWEIVNGMNFTILVCDDKSSDTRKMRRAREKNIPIYTSEEFLEKYEMD